MKHNLNFSLDWCEWCGRPRTEIIDDNVVECDGTSGRMHPRFFDAQERAKAVFFPAVKAIVEGFGYAQTFPDPDYQSLN